MNKIKLLDILTGKSVWENYQTYNITQWYSKEEMQKFQLNKLKLLLQHCNENIPYYQRIITKQGIDIEKIDSLDVLKQFPILTKEIIQANYDDFIPKNQNSIRGVKLGQTGGTTGNILFKRNDANSRSSAWGSAKRAEDWMGLNLPKKTLILMGGHVKKTSLLNRLTTKALELLSNNVKVDIYDTSNKTLETAINLLKSNKFSRIRAYPQFLFSIALKLEELEISFFVDSIYTTAEPLMPEHRALFKKVFNAEVFDQYGCGEIGGLAYECEKHEGLHITEEHVIVEQNNSNELIITDLDNYTMPFIRYWNADQAIISEKNCSCGRKSQLITQIMGRTCDYITGINGQYLHWAYFWHLIFDSDIAKNRNVKKFQIVQENNDRILVRLIADTLTEDEERFLITDIQKRIGKVNISIAYEDHIENSKTGKYRPVINHMLNL
ncbi:MAG TPA: hypothetical protein DCG75_11720 [Bacteroidales bacterium]|nr:hypothetical protein [Bacteroidales bacterium]